MQTLHGLESGQLVLSQISCGIERAGIVFFREKYGSSVEELWEDFARYTEEIEMNRGVVIEALISQLTE